MKALTCAVMTVGTMIALAIKPPVSGLDWWAEFVVFWLLATCVFLAIDIIFKDK